MGIRNISEKVKISRPITPLIYAYTTPEIKRHDGWTKIGYTEQELELRLKQQAHTVDVEIIVNWDHDALFSDGSGTFRDTDVHAYFTKIGIERNPRTEWFHIVPDDAKRHFLKFCDNHGIVDDEEPVAPYHLRKEQERAVDQTLEYMKLHENGEFLWNAKPRFGKTLTSYDLCMKMQAKRVLIVTNRPAIANSWYEDYVRFFGRASGYLFVSSVDALQGKKYCLTRDEFKTQLSGPNPIHKFINFVSLQDLKGALEFGGEFEKLDYIKDLDWDILIIDEAHEGVDTYKTDVAFDRIHRRFTLHLSGTPFKAIANEKFTEEQIFNWTYSDEQEAKRTWNDPIEQNPYEDLPKLNLFTYKMSDIVLDKVQQGIELDGETVEYAFDLNEFFATSGPDNNPHFIHDKEVDRFLDSLTSQTKYPFSTPELRDELRHTLWLLNRVNSAKALAKKLREHPVFKDYEIILAAGDGRMDDQAGAGTGAVDRLQLVEQDKATGKAYNKVIRAIRSGDRNAKTITLSVGQLTTGVTIPEWTAVLMLSNMKSPAQYMQAAFRTQNPWMYGTNSGFKRKENAYVFDFDPARTLTIFEEFANDLYLGNSSGSGSIDDRKQRVRTLLNFFPVLAEDEHGEMIELDAEKVLSIPRKIRSNEVVRRGFMCDYLFQNISSVFRAPQEVIDVLKKLEATKEAGLINSVDGNTADELSLNANGEVELPDDEIQRRAKQIFGNPKYENRPDPQELAEQIYSQAEEHKQSHKKEDGFLNYLTDEMKTRVTVPVMDAAKDAYGRDLKPPVQKRINQQIGNEIESSVRRVVGECDIDINKIKKKQEARLADAKTEEEKVSITAETQQQIDEAKKQAIVKVLESTTELTEKATKIVVTETETANRQEVKKNIEGDIKEHLRGFARTIPSFLMGYGTEHTTLENFEQGIPDKVFKDVTSITIAEFKLLRDGGTVVNKESGEEQEFAGGIFDPVVFNDAVQEFISLRSRLANYFDKTLGEDIFDYVPPQKTNQIFTPRKVVQQMVDMFEEQNPGCFDDPNHTFADLYMKSGLYITEIIKRLYSSEGMKALFPDDDARLQHILEHQVFGIAPTEIIYRIATHYILGYNNEIGRDYDTNFVQADSAELAKSGELEHFIEMQFGSKL